MLRKPGNDGQTVDTPSLGQTKLPQWAGNLSPFYPKDTLSMFSLTKPIHTVSVGGCPQEQLQVQRGHTRVINLELISHSDQIT